MLKPALLSRPVLPCASPKRAGERLTETFGRSRTASRMSLICFDSIVSRLSTSTLTGSASFSCSEREPLTTISPSAATCCAGGCWAQAGAAAPKPLAISQGSSARRARTGREEEEEENGRSKREERVEVAATKKVRQALEWTTACWTSAQRKLRG